MLNQTVGSQRFNGEALTASRNKGVRTAAVTSVIPQFERLFSFWFVPRIFYCLEFVTWSTC